MYGKGNRCFTLSIEKVIGIMSNPMNYYNSRIGRYLIEFDLIAKSARSVLDKYFIDKKGDTLVTDLTLSLYRRETAFH
jgi:hypothetical protein